jgi:hypothetical protein
MHICNKFFQKNYTSGLFVVERQQNSGDNASTSTGILYFCINFNVLLNFFDFRQNHAVCAPSQHPPIGSRPGVPLPGAAGEKSGFIVVPGTDLPALYPNMITIGQNCLAASNAQGAPRAPGFNI